MANERRRMGGRGQMPVEKAKDFKGSIGKLFAYMKQYHAAVAVVILCAIASTVFSVIGPDILGKATTELSNGLLAKIQGTGSIDFTKIGQILLFVLGLYLLSTLFSFVQGWLMTGVTQKVCYRMRKDISEKIDRMPMAYFESRTYGEVLSPHHQRRGHTGTEPEPEHHPDHHFRGDYGRRTGNDASYLAADDSDRCGNSPDFRNSDFSGGEKSQKYFKQQQEYLGHINGQVEETYAGHTVIQAYNKEKDMVQQFQETNDTLYHSAWKSQFLSGLMQPIMMFVGNLGYAAVALSGGLLAIRGTITIGDIQAFIQYVKNFTQPMQQIAQVLNQVQSMAAASERVFEFLEEAEEVQTAEHPLELANVEGNVDFQHVSFGYQPEQCVIHDFSAKVKSGQKIAIVGPTGAGKTTMVKLLMRFYDVSGGAILLDGHDVRDFDRHKLRESFGMVLQDTWLFQGTIMENIRYGRLDATDEEVIAAAKAAHADSFIRQLPDGYQMELNEDASNVSQGQKQLLTIARAILADNRVMILDEATSSVDTRTEILIQKAMDHLMEGRTSFIIAHRLSTIRNADMILVMKDGDIIEQGTHEELLEKNGFYADLYRSQFAQTA